MVNFSSVSLLPARKREAVNQGGTREIGHPTRKRTRGAGIINGREDKRGSGLISDTFM